MPITTQRYEPKLDPRVTAAVHSHREAAVNAINRWYLDYRRRHPGDMRITPGSFSLMVEAEARRQREGRPKREYVEPPVEIAAETTERLRKSLVQFLEDWGVISRHRRTPPSVDRIPGSPIPIAPQPASAVGTLPAGAPPQLYELLRVALHGDALTAAVRLLEDRMRDSPIGLPSPQAIEAAWERYRQGSAPARDTALNAWIHHWGFMKGWNSPPATDRARSPEDTSKTWQTK